jgi:hypothetical protein
MTVFEWDRGSSFYGLWAQVLQPLRDSRLHKPRKDIIIGRNFQTRRKVLEKLLASRLAAPTSDCFEQQVAGVPSTPGPLPKHACDTSNRRYEWH